MPVQLVTIQDERLLHWAELKLETSWNKDQVRWLSGVDSQVRFVVVYSRFSERACEMAIATDGSRRWATKQTLHAIFALPFKQWGLRRVAFLVEATNEKSQKMLRQAGAEREGLLRKANKGDVDVVVFGMLKEECRWIS